MRKLKPGTRIRERRITIGGVTMIQQIREPSHRTANCQDCGDDLDSSFNDPCPDCGWLICDCGECGC